MNDDVGLILGGFQSAAQGLQPLAQEQMQERADNKPLSPYEKWLGKVMSGELSPQQAATNAKLELQGHTIPEQVPQALSAQTSEQPKFGYSPGMGSQPPSPMIGLASPQSQPQQISPTPQTQSYPGPMTRTQGLSAMEPQTHG